MPNHFHLVIEEIVNSGISKFMQKLMTAYTMYFNKKYERSGGLFTRPFRSKHIHDDQYLREVIQYVHLNPIELLQLGMNDHTDDTEISDTELEMCRFSSLPDYLGQNRPQRVLVAKALP